MDGALRLALTSGARFIDGASVDFNFQKDRYLLNGNLAARSDIDAYHTRSSAAYAQLVDGSYLDHSINAARIVSGIGYQHEEAATGLLDPIAMNSLFAGGAVITPHVGTFLGIFNDSAKVASNGQTWHRLSTPVPDMLAGEQLAITAFVSAGTSTQATCFVTATLADLTINYPSIGGELGSFPAQGVIEDAGVTEHVDTIDRGNGIYEIRLLFTASVDVTALTFGMGPRSLVAGEYIYVHGFDIKEGAAFSTVANGARASDALIMSPSDFSMDLSEGFGIIKWEERDTSDDWNYLLNFRGGDNFNRISILRHPTSKYVGIQLWSGTEIVAGVSIDKPANGTINTAGVSWGGGSCRLLLNDASFNDDTALSPSGSTNISIGSSHDGSGANNAITHRVVIGEIKPTNSEFDAIFAEVAA